MSTKDDYIGKRFGNLTIVGTVGVINKNTHYECACDCGSKTIVSRPNIRSGSTKSCGCTSYERTIKNKNFLHLKSRTKLYQVWNGIKTRCLNSKSDGYKNYGGRGIKLFEEWKNPMIFYDWAINNGYKEGLSIDRINNNGDYEPNNCRFVDMFIQNNNKRKFWREERNTDKGVTFDVKRKKYIAQITISRKHYSKRFENQQDAKTWRKEMMQKEMKGIR